MKRLITTCITLIIISLAVVAKGATLAQSPSSNDFTPLEQQQISIETKGLFDKSNAFQVDFSVLKPSEYSFPLPVGKTTSVTTSEIEIETKKGDAVKAMFDGIVRISRNNPTHGNVVVIRHDNGLETVYAHNAQNLVKSGDHVKAGQTVAIVGGTNDRIYCQFAIMVNGRRINPETILDTHFHSLRKQTVIFRKSGNKIDITTSRYEKKGKPTDTAGSTSNSSTAPHGSSNGTASDTEEPAGMPMTTNNPFGSNAVYRLDLTAIKNWHYPLEGSHVISGYGGKRRHAGVDIKNAPNKEIFAVFDGEVVQSGVFAGYGNCITLRHANGLETRYSHNSKNLVKVGDQVKAGDVIGLTGRTGRATTEHLHFETRIAGRAFDPAYVLDHANHSLHQCTLQFKKNGSVTRLK